MKLAAWNCNMAFRKKMVAILPYQADILVIPECENREKLKWPAGVKVPDHQLWHGDNPHKGIGIFAFNGFRLKLHASFNPDLKYVVPVVISRGKEKYFMLAIWANNPGDREGKYVTQVWKAIHHYEKKLRGSNILLAGDFNSNTIWDQPRRKGNHSTVVSFLGQRKIYSTYHWHHQQEQGKEMHPTLYLYRQETKPYHIDYCFASRNLVQLLKSVEIGEFGNWKSLSDHVPLIVDFANRENIITS
jgi:exonuclease III